ncbi:Crp/Fnr family transcriptional regulator [Prauserella alba]|uniref:Crp/Fnr family transcriptional regulator n=1 Tax=Prauserella alba TaxID=176898 RepID=A0ABP4FUJ1_9PSEU|nr:Crp/Fnr family transcriptional regulator [Prauserella alba]MCP2179628.1 cAMP-binding domain of CRP or a regulatory subunit of cAMP-dependent protein kinases [Prauserella alba]
MHHDVNIASRGFRGLLGERLWSVLITMGVERRHKPGDVLLRQGDRGDYLLALTGGRVKILAAESGGAELLLSLRSAGDLVGEMSPRSDSRRTATVETLDSCTTSYLARPDFEAFLGRHGAHAAFSDYLVAKLSETVPYQLQQAHFAPRQRVARLILEVLLLADPGDRDRARIPFSQDALAKALGLARSTVADQIATLRTLGALRSGPRIVVDDERALSLEAHAISL